MIQLSKKAVEIAALETVEFLGQKELCGELKRFYTAIGLKLSNIPYKLMVRNFVLGRIKFIITIIFPVKYECNFIRCSKFGVLVNVRADEYLVNLNQEFFKRGKLWNMML